MLKNVDVSFYDVVKSAVEGKSTGSNVFDYGLKEGWVGPTYSDQMKSIVPADIIGGNAEVPGEDRKRSVRSGFDQIKI